MSYDSLKATAVAAIAKAGASAAASGAAADASKAAAAQALTDLSAAQVAVMAIQPDPVVPPTPVPPVITPDGTKSPPAASIVGSDGHVFTLANGHVVVDGTPNLNTVVVSAFLIAVGGKCVFQGTDSWYIASSTGGSSTKTTDPTPPPPTPPPTPSGNGFALAQTAPPGYTGKIGAPLLKDDFKTLAVDPALWYPARNPGDDWSGPFNTGEQEVFTHDMVTGDGDVMWISTGTNDAGLTLPSGFKPPYKSGCFTTQNGAPSHVWGEGTLLQARVCFMPGPNNWQAGGGYGADHGYPRECDWFELTDQLLQLNKHYPNSSGGNAETGQRGWGPSTIRDGKFHILGLEWLPGKLTTYFDGVKQIVMTCPTDSEKYTLCFNNAIRGTANLGRTMGVDWVVISPVTSPGA